MIPYIVPYVTATPFEVQTVANMAASIDSVFLYRQPVSLERGFVLARQAALMFESNSLRAPGNFCKSSLYSRVPSKRQTKSPENACMCREYPKF